MACQNLTIIKSPESRLLEKCRKENRPFEYYVHMANQRRNLLYDPVLLVDTPFDYYAPTSHFHTRYMSVPCGKCDLCLKTRVDKYFIRCYYQFLHTTIARNGSAWFLTLTYGDEVLPRACDGTPCFSKHHVQTFLKRMRKYSGLDFKYFIVTEFGGEFGRPHYHAIFFIDNFESTDRNKFKLLDYVAKSWTKINDRDPKYSSMSYLGLFDMQRVDVQPLKDTLQIRYCCKYVGKQFGIGDFDERKDIPDDCKRFHLQSIGLGSAIYDYCNKDVWDKGYLECDGYKYSIPDYYKLQKMREYYCTHEDGTIIYRPTNFKYQYMANLCREMFREHKMLAMLNSDYPVPPSWTYSPEILERILVYIDDYVIFREQPKDVEICSYLDDWNDYLLRVQQYNKGKLDAQALKWKQQQEGHYLKKTGCK